MKKSDFLKELYEAVDDYLDSRKHFEYNNLVDMIVDKSLELGMMPPKNGYDYISIEDDEIAIPEYKWDKEDEDENG